MGNVKMVAVQCPNCNDTVSQEDAKDGYCTCPSCGTTFIINDDTPKTYINSTINKSVNINIGNGVDAIFDSYYNTKKDYDKFKEESNRVEKAAFPYTVAYTIILALLVLGGYWFYVTNLEVDYDTYSYAGKPTYTEPTDLSKQLEIVVADGSSYVDGEVTIAYNWLDDSLKDIKLHAEPVNNLGTGDIVKISISDLGSHDESEFKSLEWEWTFDLMTMQKMD